MLPEIVADTLQSAICDAVCSEPGEIRDAARKWLMLDKMPSRDEIFKPEPGSFIYSCRCLGLRWISLRSALIMATRIDEAMVRIAPVLTLVQPYELSYNGAYEHRNVPETNNDSDGACQTTQGQRELHLQIVPTSKGTSKIH